MPITEAGALKLAHALLDPAPELTITLAASLIMRAVMIDEINTVKRDLERVRQLANKVIP